MVEHGVDGGAEEAAVKGLLAADHEQLSAAFAQHVLQFAPLRTHADVNLHLDGRGQGRCQIAQHIDCGLYPERSIGMQGRDECAFGGLGYNMHEVKCGSVALCMRGGGQHIPGGMI